MRGYGASGADTMSGGDLNFGTGGGSSTPSGPYPLVLIKRGTRAQLDAAAAAGQLLDGQDYLITDEGRLAVGTSTTTYVAAAKQGEGSSVDWADVTGKPATFPSSVHAHENATPSAAGFLSAVDKAKLDALTITVSATAPANPNIGDLWVDTST